MATVRRSTLARGLSRLGEKVTATRRKGGRNSEQSLLFFMLVLCCASRVYKGDATIHHHEYTLKTDVVPLFWGWGRLE